MADGGGGLRRVGAEFVAVVIDVGIIKSDEVGALLGRELEPGDHLIDARRIGKLIVEMKIVGRALAGDLSLRAGPEKTGGAHSLLLGKRPERDAAVPGAVEFGLLIRHRIRRLARGIVKLVGDDAGVLGV